MALAAASADLGDGRSELRAAGRAYMSAGLKTWLDRIVSAWIFVGGLVIIEPSPYEFMFAIVLPLALFAGLKVYRSTVGLFLIAAASCRSASSPRSRRPSRR